MPEQTSKAQRPTLVAEVDRAADFELVTLSPGIENNDLSVEAQIIDLEHDLQPADVHAEDVINLASDVYPMEDVDPADPLDDKVMRLAALLVEYGQVDKQGMRMALSTALKQLRLRSDLDRFDQSAAGRSADAMDAMAGARHGYRPSRLIFRLAYQTKWERWWKTFGHDDKVENKWMRRLRPGPSVRAEDISYWIVIRSCWHCMRPVNGVMQIIAQPDIPTDARPEDVMGDDWKVVEGLPQQRIGQKGPGVIDSNQSLLFANLGYLSNRPGMMFGEWIDHAMDDSNTSSKIDDEKERKLPEAVSNFLSLMKILAVLISVFGLGLVVFTKIL